METYLKKFKQPTKCSDEKCKTMITEAHNDRLLCDTCYEVWKRAFRVALLADFGYVSPYLDRDYVARRKYQGPDYSDI